MAGEIIKTTGTVLDIRPFSRTSHVVTWLTPEAGPVTTVVKGAVRPKSAFLGQYDLFYTCELLYYAHAAGDLHALREVVPLARRDGLRGCWRETALAGYAADLVRDLAPASGEADLWHRFLASFLDELSAAAPAPPRKVLGALIRLEMEILRLTGLTPDFSGLNPREIWTPFAIDRGVCGEGKRLWRLTPETAAALRGAENGKEEDAVRFLGVFLAYHLERTAAPRRLLVSLLATGLTSSPRA